jgi:translation initiation factor IF-1
MAKDSELIETTGVVIDVLPNSTFKVKMDDTNHLIICYLSGKLKQHKIKIVLNDKVKLEFSAYDFARGRITFRL